MNNYRAAIQYDGRREPEEMERILAAEDCGQAGYTAPACGLMLLSVEYGE